MLKSLISEKEMVEYYYNCYLNKIYEFMKNVNAKIVRKKEVLNILSSSRSESKRIIKKLESKGLIKINEKKCVSLTEEGINKLASFHAELKKNYIKKGPKLVRKLI